ncbi:MAG TPA: imidazole glycerol phosphate synthase subunit HisH [Vicinamibacterales bacterium]|nr:imidazole glycerol phosphate synthase subunit HisH [Vicinamibacterales bacterium]
MKAALIDYGAGNLASVRKALRRVGFEVECVAATSDLAGCAALVLPGVGHFSATRPLQGAFRQAILDRLEHGMPLLGICLGLQWLFEGSDEAPDVPGLGVLAGRCFRLRGDVKVPHVGWNTLEKTRESRLLQGIERAAVYFTHTFAAPVTAECAATTTHGLRFSSVVERGAVFGVQWHPEKSGEAGLATLRNFADVVSSC